MTTLRPRPGIGVSALITCKNELLLAKRGKPPAKGLWSLPGGKLEFGETLEQGVIREIQEETRLVINAPRFLQNVEIIREGFHYIIAVHHVELAEKPTDLRAQDDAEEIIWTTVDQLSDIPMTDGTADIIRTHLS